MFAPLLVLPFVQLLSQPQQPWDKSHDLVSANQKTVSDMLQHILQYSPTDIKATPTCTQPISRRRTPQAFADIYLRLCADSTQVDIFQDTCSGSYDHLAIVLCGVAVRVVMVGVEGVERIVRALTTIARYDPTMVSDCIRSSTSCK